MSYTQLWNWFCYAPYALFALTMLTFVVPTCRRIRFQAVWAMFLLLCFSKFLVYRELGADAFAPWLPEKVIWIWNWLYAGACILCGLGVVTVFFRFNSKVLVLPIVAWGFAAWGVYNGVAVPSIHEVTMEFEDLPRELDGYRIAQVSDIHASSAARRWRTEKIVEKVNSAAVDLICLTGDFVDEFPDRGRKYLEPLKDLKAKDGVYAVTGNHEESHAFNNWLPLYEKWGVHFLRNEGALVHEGLALGGVDDINFGGGRTIRGKTRVETAFAKATKGEFRILLQHRPSGAKESAAKDGVRLQLSGHTHGGVFPGLSLVIGKWNEGFIRGEYDLGKGAKLYVSPGTGQWAGFPIRFFDPSEITVITLKRAP